MLSAVLLDPPGPSQAASGLTTEMLPVMSPALLPRVGRMRVARVRGGSSAPLLLDRPVSLR